jgi:hypothetical protein
VLRELMAFETAGPAPTSRAPRGLRRVVTKRAVVFLISDFQADGYDKTLRSSISSTTSSRSPSRIRARRISRTPGSSRCGTRDGRADRHRFGPRRGEALFAERFREGNRAHARRPEATGTEILELSTGTDYDRALLLFLPRACAAGRPRGGVRCAA